jgi:hypothetical protein
MCWFHDVVNYLDFPQLPLVYICTTFNAKRNQAVSRTSAVRVTMFIQDFILFNPILTTQQKIE